MKSVRAPKEVPAVSARGLSWKAVASVASVLFALAGSVVTYVYTQAEERTERRAEHREVVTRLRRIEDDVERMTNRVEAYGIRIGGHDTRLAVLEADVDDIEHEVAHLKRVSGR